MINKLIIVGAGDFGRQISYYVDLQGKYNLIGFLDDNKKTGELFDGKPVIGSISQLDSLYQDKFFDYVFIALGYYHFKLRSSLYLNLKEKGIPLATIISPYACIMPGATIGHGCWIGGNAFVGPRAFIGDNTFINGGSQIAHDCKIGQHCFIAGSVVIGGYSNIGSKVFLGLHSTIDDHLSIADDVVVGACSHVSKNINFSGTYVKDKLFKNIFLFGH